MAEDSLILRINEVSSNIKHEDNLIGQRTTWLVTSQSFLVGAFVALLVGIHDPTRAARAIWLMRLLIPLVGLLLPLLVLSAVAGAACAILRMRTDHDRLRNAIVATGLDWPTRHPFWVTIAGVVLPIGACLVFLFAWSVILIETEV